MPARQHSRPRNNDQIPIGPADRLSGLSRTDFLPWRFSDAGRRDVWTAVMPASEKPAQQRKSDALTCALGGTADAR